MNKQPERPAGVPFSFFVSLLREISQVPPRTTGNLSANSDRMIRIFNRWIIELRRRYSPLPHGTIATTLLLLFPEEDSRRKYNMQETSLARELAKCFGVSMEGRGESLRRWNGEATLGCLGADVMKILDEACSDMDNQTRGLTITEVDTLLDELASTSAFSDPTLRKYRSAKPRTRNAILRDLYAIPALDASFLTQIILKDLRPLLFPLAGTHYTVALTKYNTKSVTPLSKEDVMRALDPSGRMLEMYKVRASLHEAANAFEMEPNGHHCPTTPQPQIGTPVEIPKSLKARGCIEAIKHFATSHQVWAETKYDGERAQIHVDIRDDGSSHITIFSKSKRDSTFDRWGIHGIIRDALGLTKHANRDGHFRSKVTKNVILDAEMVAFSDRLNKIDEFWRIRSLITNTARAARGGMFAQPHAPSENHGEPVSQASLVSDASDTGTRHLALVFFDVLVLDSTSLLSTPYASRRSVLESIIQIRPGYVILADRSPIILTGPHMLNHANSQLRAIWARVIADGDEGLVLKADEGFYHDYQSPWVKLKKDYIPGYGDTVDLVIVAASWDKNRARELRVSPMAYTTFYAGALANTDALTTDPSVRPHFEIYFTVSYGLGREQLEEANFLIMNSDPVHYNVSRKVPKGLPYTFNMYSGLPLPVVLFQEPLLAEICGAGFTKAPQSKYYELRFPRLTKLYRASSRPWSDGVTLQDLHKIARQSVGRDRSTKDVDDWTKEVWGNVPSPGVRCEKKRKEREVGWVEKLGLADGVGRTRKKKLKALDSSSPLRDKDMRLGTGATNVVDRPVLGVKPLGSLFNIADSLPMPPPSNAMRARRAGPGGMKDRQKNTFVVSVMPSISTLTPAIGSQMATPPLSADSISKVYASKPIVTFVKDAFVWFAQPCNTPRPTWRPPIKDLLGLSCRLHSLESLLTGCGWQSQGVAMKHGVVFVDQSTSYGGRSWKEYTLKTLQERHALLTPATRRNPIWVFDVVLLGFDALETTEGDVRQLALCRFD